MSNKRGNLGIIIKSKASPARKATRVVIPPQTQIVSQNYLVEPAPPQRDSGSQLQSVAQFKDFLMQHDSQFVDFIGSDLLVQILDAQLMKDSMISFMAQLMRQGEQRDNFYIKSRAAIQDTVALHYVLRAVQASQQLDFYLPSLVEMVGDLLDCERCSIYLYDRA